MSNETLDRLVKLLDLQKHLRWCGYIGLELKFFYQLQSEVNKEIEKLKAEN